MLSFISLWRSAVYVLKKFNHAGFHNKFAYKFVTINILKNILSSLANLTLFDPDLGNSMSKQFEHTDQRAKDKREPKSQRILFTL